MDGAQQARLTNPELIRISLAIIILLFTFITKK